MRYFEVSLTDKVIHDLDWFAMNNDLTRAQAFNRALSLISLINQEYRKGNTLGVVKELPNGELIPIAKINGV